ncbi:MAG TPA: low molecular weight phosphatase family protein [Actinomycetota bacterium]
MLRVLFVCTGNICRSPLAEAFLLERARGLPEGLLSVRSAGTWGREGHPAMPETIAIGVEHGLDVGDHAASPLTTDLIEGHDLLVGMARDHVAEIARMVPDSASRAFTLKELAHLLSSLEEPLPKPDVDAARARIAAADELRRARGGPADGDVSDPIGLGLDVYRMVAGEIEAALDQVVEGLFGVRVSSGARKEGP